MIAVQKEAFKKVRDEMVDYGGRGGKKLKGGRLKIGPAHAAVLQKN